MHYFHIIFEDKVWKNPSFFGVKPRPFFSKKGIGNGRRRYDKTKDAPAENAGTDGRTNAAEADGNRTEGHNITGTGLKGARAPVKPQIREA